MGSPRNQGDTLPARPPETVPLKLVLSGKIRSRLVNYKSVRHGKIRGALRSGFSAADTAIDIATLAHRAFPNCRNVFNESKTNDHVLFLVLRYLATLSTPPATSQFFDERRGKRVRRDPSLGRAEEGLVKRLPNGQQIHPAHSVRCSRKCVWGKRCHEYAADSGQLVSRVFASSLGPLSWSPSTYLGRKQMLDHTSWGVCLMSELPYQAQSLLNSEHFWFRNAMRRWQARLTVASQW